MKVSSIIVGALAAVVSATPIPGKEVSKRSSEFAFGAGNVFGNLAGSFDPLLLNNFQFQDPLLAHLALVSGIDGLGIQNLAINNGLALDGFVETLLFQAQAGQLALSSILSINTLATVSWLLNNNFLNTGLNVGGLALPNALSFGLLDQFGFDQFAFNVNINDVLNQEILASLSNSLLFSGGGFGGAAVVSSVQSTVIVKE